MFTKDTVQKLFIEYGFKVEKIENELFPGEDVSVTMNIVGVK